LLILHQLTADCPILYGMLPTRYKLNRQRNQDASQGELALLDRIRNRTGLPATGEIRLGIGDDCALLHPKPSEELAVTTDLSIAGRHFRLDWHPPEAIGHRTLARGLSDLAAMGARPVAAFLSLGLPRELTIRRGGRPAWFDRFLDGFLGLANACKTPLAGGDLAESPVTVADIVLIGAVPKGRALLRSGARPGDLVYVTGSLGGAAAALLKLGQLAAATRTKAPSISNKNKNLLAPHLHPQPRIPQGLWLQRRGLATASIDLSDGLSTDLAHLCAESGVTAEVEAAALPLHPAATLDQALNGGEDYELLVTAPPDVKLPPRISGIAITRIGRILPARHGRSPVTLISAEGAQPLRARGWQHFS
jgi:thiamine-monophosphate kinase